MIEAKIILDSISPDGIRLTTFELKFHRFELASLNTHRIMSKNSSSNRAIPNSKVLKEILYDLAWPVFWGKNKAGMQANEELTGIKLVLVKGIWKVASIIAVGLSYTLSKLGLHKQLCNRLIEPFAWTRTILTATELDNFFTLRCHKAAQYEIKMLAELMRDEYNRSIPTRLDYNEWHLPYMTSKEKETLSLEECQKISVARCARVSYLNHDGKQTSKEKDFELYDRLVGSNPRHYSPLEHQATPMKGKKFFKNFRGWKSYRAFDEENLRN